jgi:hypothetical protein
MHRGATHHGRLRREELEREVVGAIRQRIDLIRNLLHCAEGSERRTRSGVAEHVESLFSSRWQRLSKVALSDGEGGARDRQSGFGAS